MHLPHVPSRSLSGALGDISVLREKKLQKKNKLETLLCRVKQHMRALLCRIALVLRENARRERDDERGAIYVVFAEADPGPKYIRASLDDGRQKG